MKTGRELDLSSESLGTHHAAEVRWKHLHHDSAAECDLPRDEDARHPAAAKLALEIRRTGTNYVVVARLFKSDLAGKLGDAFAALTLVRPPYLRARLIIPNPDDGRQEFILLEVDREALDHYVAGAL